MMSSSIEICVSSLFFVSLLSQLSKHECGEQVPRL